MKEFEAIRCRVWEICDEMEIAVSKLLSEAGLSKNWLNSLRNGVSPSISTIRKICRYAGITIQEFFARKYFLNMEDNK